MSRPAITKPDAGDLPHPLTFFLSADDRALVLRALRRRDRHRSTALLRALRIDDGKGARNARR